MPLVLSAPDMTAKVATAAGNAAENAAEHVTGNGGTYLFIIIFLISAAVIVPLFQRYKISSVLGFLLVGVMMGPDVLGRLTDAAPWLGDFSVMRSHAVHQLAELGVVFLLFSIGLELTFERLKSMRRLVFGLGGAQIVISSLILALLFYFLGRGLTGSAMLGMALALSSTAVVIPVLADRKALRTTSGKSVFAILLAQDLAVAPIMVTAVMLTGAASGEAQGLTGLLALIPALIGMAAIVVGGRWLLRPLFNHAAFSRSRELFMAACLLVVVVSGQVSVMAGMSMALGAFIAGVLLAETEYRREIEVMIEPFKGLLLGLFFITVGARLDLASVLANPQLVLGLAAGLILIKAAVVYPLARAFGLPPRSAIETAAVLGPAGEFAFVVIDEAIRNRAVDAPFGQAVIVAAILSMFSIPLLAALAGRLGRKVQPQVTAVAPDNAADSENTPKVIVVGFGRVGELVTEMLREHKIPFTVVDFNPQVVRRCRAAGHEAWYGDASVPDFLDRMGMTKARAVVVTASNPGFTDQCVQAIRSMREDIHIIARARDAAHAQRLYQMGATDAVPETIEASLQLAENTLIDLGIPMGLVLASVHEKRDSFRRQFGTREGEGAAILRAAMKRPAATADEAS